MIDLRYGKQVPICTGCEEELPPCDTWQEAVDAMEEAGWVYYPREEANYCKTCQEDL